MPFLIAIEYALFLWYNPSDMNILIDQIFENKEESERSLAAAYAERNKDLGV